ncbi:MAG: peptidylprolyl isomerase [Granulicella sp.]
MGTRQITMSIRSLGGAVALALVTVLVTFDGVAQSPVTPPATQKVAASPRGTVLDQVVVVVNGDLVLESDIDEDRRFQAFQPFRDDSQSSRDKLIERLVDRTLILQQEKIQPQHAIPDAEVIAQLNTLRKEIPDCKEYKCETDAGWQKFIADQGFTMPELIARWRDRMEVLRFIEQRFRMGIRVSPEDIKTYYEKMLLPGYAARKAQAPKLEVISDRIQEILLQQQVSALLDDWLKSLKAQGTVRMTRPDEAQP